MRRPEGWDERDYDFWSELQSLPSYGLIADNSDNPLISRRDVENLMEKQAQKRAAREGK